MIVAAAVLSLLPLAAPATAPEQKWDMTTFTLVLVRPYRHAKPADEPRPLTAAETGALEDEHQALLRKLAADKKVLAWGPIENDSGLFEVIILDVPEKKEAFSLLKDDPWFRSERRVPELHPWFAARGILKPPAEGAARETLTFGLLRRPPDAPQLPEEKLKEIQQGHMANIEAMAASGELAIAGPLVDEGPLVQDRRGGFLRGVFVFRGTDEKHLREIAAPDAAIQAGRLVLDLYRWVVPRGTLPPR